MYEIRDKRTNKWNLLHFSYFSSNENKNNATQFVIQLLEA